MKTTLKHAFILLAAASNLLLTTPEAQALEQKIDLQLRILNSTKLAIDFCDTRPPDCRVDAPGATYTDGLMTDGKQMPSFYHWLYGMTIKICGKSMLLSREITPPVQDSNGSSKIFYTMSITEENYQRVCRDEKTERPLKQAMPPPSHISYIGHINFKMTMRMSTV